jgi:hypothetical protein
MIKNNELNTISWSTIPPTVPGLYLALSIEESFLISVDEIDGKLWAYSDYWMCRYPIQVVNRYYPNIKWSRKIQFMED